MRDFNVIQGKNKNVNNNYLIDTEDNKIGNVMLSMVKETI